MRIYKVRGLFAGNLKFMSMQKSSINAYIDTGACQSYITTGALRSILPDYVEYLKSALPVESTVKLANGTKESVATVLMRNVLICDFPVRSFKCHLQVSDYNLALIGMDFISACKGELLQDTLVLQNFSEDVYAGNMISHYKGSAVELNSLFHLKDLTSTPTNARLKWCRENAPEALQHLSDTELWDIMSSAYFENR